MKSPTKKRKSSVRKCRKKINARKKMRKSWNGKALMRVLRRKETRIVLNRVKKSVNGKGHG